jgi:tetratricopeptide (TPR) repeat protein
VEKLGHGIDEILTDRTIELCRAGETYLSKRQYIDAEIHLWQALQINPEYIPALIDMGSLRAEQRNFEKAIQYFSKALAIDPLNATAHFNLSTLYKRQGRFAEAQAELIKFKESESIAKQKGEGIQSVVPVRRLSE